MATPFEAAWEVGQFLAEHGISYAVIGGLAVQFWGDVRLTIDADLTVASSLAEGSEPFVDLITGQFQSRIANPREFARRNRVVLITTSNGVDVDISLGLPGYEEEMLRRVVEFEWEPGKILHVCSAEDLVIHKAIAGRPQDVSDIQGIVYRQREKLDLAYIRSWLIQFAEILGNPAIEQRFEQAWNIYLGSK
jgi:hypothetical protein